MPMCRINRQHPMMGQSIQTCRLRRWHILLCGRLVTGHLTFSSTRSSLRGCIRRRCRRPRELYGLAIVWTYMLALHLDVYRLLYGLWYELLVLIWIACDAYCDLWNYCNICCDIYELPMMYILLGFHIREQKNRLKHTFIVCQGHGTQQRWHSVTQWHTTKMQFFAMCLG